jgi:hypothetical protein
VKVLETNHEQWYEIVERDDGTVVLEIVLPAPAAAFATYVMHVPFTAEELARYREEGRSFLRWFIDRVRDAPDDYTR